MASIFATLLVLVCLFLILEPLIRKKSEAESVEQLVENHELEFLKLRERVYEEIRTLQQEWLIKSLSEESYKTEIDRLRLEAAALLRDQTAGRNKIVQLQSDLESTIGESH